MEDWIAHDHRQYVDLASHQASLVSHLRNNRQSWREQLQNSPLGDPLDLMHHLESSFSTMHADLLKAT